MNAPNLLRVTHIRAEGLFQRYSHEVPLRLEDRVTIIHGPNGVGKTVLLRLASALLSGRLSLMARIPFKRFEVVLSDGATLGFEKPEIRSNEQSGNEAGGIFYLKRADSERQQVEFTGGQLDVTRLAARIEAQVPWLTRLDKDRFMDNRTDEILTSAEVIERHPEYLRNLPPRIRRLGGFSEPDWMSDIKQRVGVHFIEAQRLFRFGRPSREWEYPRSATYVATVKDYARELQEKIGETLAAYAKESQALDQSFPQRLLQSATKTLPVEELKERMQALEDKRQQLKRIGLIAEDPAYPFDITTLEKLDPTRLTVMTLYAEDTARKLGVLDDLARRVGILLENINRKFEHKSIRIDREKGITAVSDKENLALDSLSSGEQHELVLLYDLLFRVKPNTLVLIDEPELSLHVTWQKSFLPDLLKIVATTSFDVLLATHSPFIVGDRHDLMVPLYFDGRPNAANDAV